MPSTTQVTGTAKAKVIIGSQNEWEATLPLTAAEADLATDQQRNEIGRAALIEILAEGPEKRRLAFPSLRDEIRRRTGLDSAAASLAVWSARDELEDF